MRSGGNRADLKFGEGLTVALPLLVVLAAAHLEDANLVMPALSHHGGLDAGTSDQGGPDHQFSAVADSQHLIDRDLLANVRSNLFYFDLLAGSDSVLLATGFYDRVHISPFSETNQCLRAETLRCCSADVVGALDPRNKREARDHSMSASATTPATAIDSGRDRGSNENIDGGVPIMRRHPQATETSVQPASPQTTALPQDALAQMRTELAEVDAVIQRRLSSSVALIDQIGHYIISAGGKRIRPLLVLLFSDALGFRGKERYELAATVEFIHTATLLHDDVVDESALRRGRQTANALFGNAASVLVGDFVYSRAFQMMVSLNRMRVLDVLADATNVIAEGEVLQLMNMHDPDLAVDDYLRVIRYKTAKLFEASARLGAVLADAPVELEEACADFGRSLGTAFQLVDDLLDYEGATNELGKNVGDDLREGKPTLPLLLAMARGTDTDRQIIREAIEHGEVARLADIVAIVRRTGAIDATRDAARAEADKARQCLFLLPDSRAREALLELCFRSVERTA